MGITMKKILIIVLALSMMLVACDDSKDTLEEKLEGKWLLLERQMVIEFDTVEDDYVEFKDTFDLESQVQARHIRYNPEDEFELDFEHMNITSFYVQSFGEGYSDVENYIQTENTYYTAEYREDEVFYKLDEERSNREYVDSYEINGFTNKVEFKDGK
jgi:hypothetical protein